MVTKRTFKASDALVDILLQYGFSDNTYKHYPQHYKRMQVRGYDPYNMKRIFVPPHSSDYLIFHYTNMILHHDGVFNHTEERMALSISELRSLVAFYKLPAEQGREWLEAYMNALELYKYYDNIYRLPEIFDSPVDNSIKNAFESTLIEVGTPNSIMLLRALTK